MAGPGEPTHIPVLYQEVLKGLQIKPGGRYVDGTLGGGGHAAGILEKSSPDGRLLGIDADPMAIAISAERLAEHGPRVTVVNANFARLAEVASQYGFCPADGILLDLGLSSLQLAAGERGFSFQLEGPLDMRFNPHQGRPASDLVNGLSTSELADVLHRYGEERRAQRIAQAIVAARPIHTTLQLADVVARAVGRRGRIHPATRTFQALRIAVNDELSALSQALPQAVELLAPQGRLVVISYHSLEDRLVKQFYRQESQDCICPPEVPVCRCDHRATLEIVTKKTIRPSELELKANPRCRSARLRIAARLASG
ncbi:MAG: 16S rRNA (cytosine(1402)-N(4))-methyltransferase RsmH [Anaerolineae bacterium]